MREFGCVVDTPEDTYEYDYLATISRDNVVLTIGVFNDKDRAQIWCDESIELMKQTGRDDVEIPDDWDKENMQ
jgi:hypothetical protein